MQCSWNEVALVSWDLWDGMGWLISTTSVCTLRYISSRVLQGVHVGYMFLCCQKMQIWMHICTWDRIWGAEELLTKTYVPPSVWKSRLELRVVNLREHLFLWKSQKVKGFLNYPSPSVMPHCGATCPGSGVDSAGTLLQTGRSEGREGICLTASIKATTLLFSGTF